MPLIRIIGDMDDDDTLENLHHTLALLRWEAERLRQVAEGLRREILAYRALAKLAVLSSAMRRAHE